MDTKQRSEADQQNERLTQQYQEIAQLAGGLAHEIKNPLSTIRLNMQLLAEELEEMQTPQSRRAMKKIEAMQRESLRLQGLLEDFLRFTKAGRLELVPTDLNALINELLDFYQPTAEESRVEVIRLLDAALPRVKVDPEALRRAFLNLIINAVQAMPEGGKLCVRTMPSGDSVDVQLIDTGGGIDEKTGAQLFDAFFSTKPGGSGLGLPTTAKIIEAHGGRISIQSEVGVGTQFTVELPVPARLEEG